MELYAHLLRVLESQKQFFQDGKLIKSLITEAAHSLEPALLESLWADPACRQVFFQALPPSGIWVFDTPKFQKFILQQQFLPHSYTAFRNQIGLAIEERLLAHTKEVVLNFPYKDCLLQGGQSKDKAHQERFLNPVLAHAEIDRLLEAKALAHWKRYDARTAEKLSKVGELGLLQEGIAYQVHSSRLAATEKVDFDQQNLLIKGNNLIALHSLKKRYSGKVKLIYIDPPYNTGKDGFQYHDRFSHSTWLTFMKNRLEVAKDLLAEDGAIFVHCDDNEQAYLKVLMDEIFGRDNFEATIANVVKPEGRNYGNIAKALDYILVYFKNRQDGLLHEIEGKGEFAYQDPYGGFNIKELRNGNSAFHIGNRPNLYYPIYVLPQPDRYGFCAVSPEPTEQSIAICYPPAFQSSIQGVWRWGREKAKAESHQLLAKKVKDGWGIFQKQRKHTVKAKNFFNEKEFYTSRGNQELKALALDHLFQNPKPEFLLKRIIEMATSEGDWVLDFFAGSGTTGAVAHKLRRRYILIEQMDYIQDLTLKRLQKVLAGEQGGISEAVRWQGGGDFLYCELAKDAQTYTEQIAQATDTETLKQLWQSMKESTFVDYRLELSKWKEADFERLTLEEQKDTLLGLIDQNQLYVPYADCKDASYALSENDIVLSQQFYADLKNF